MNPHTPTAALCIRRLFPLVLALSLAACSSSSHATRLSAQENADVPVAPQGVSIWELGGKPYRLVVSLGGKLLWSEYCNTNSPLASTADSSHSNSSSLPSCRQLLTLPASEVEPVKNAAKLGLHPGKASCIRLKGVVLTGIDARNQLTTFCKIGNGTSLPLLVSLQGLAFINSLEANP